MILDHIYSSSCKCSAAAQEDSLVPERMSLSSSPTRNIPAPSEPLSLSAKPMSQAPTTVTALQVHGDTSGSELTESDEEEEHRVKRKAPAKRKDKSKAAAPVKKQTARSVKKQKE
ncbi:hypothetical protein BDR04DRAFT_1093998 [Suillus decipiens]|nr:hypothetical protein BDR04DRAFT_1093998 [Suillus decipiens]